MKNFVRIYILWSVVTLIIGAYFQQISLNHWDLFEATYYRGSVVERLTAALAVASLLLFFWRLFKGQEKVFYGFFLAIACVIAGEELHWGLTNWGLQVYVTQALSGDWTMIIAVCAVGCVGLGWAVYAFRSISLSPQIQVLCFCFFLQGFASVLFDQKLVNEFRMDGIEETLEMNAVLALVLIALRLPYRHE